MSDLPFRFLVRAWRTDSSKEPVDTAFETFDEALEAAYLMALDKQYQQVMVIDPWATLWVQFNMLWALDPAPSPR